MNEYLPTSGQPLLSKVLTKSINDINRCVAEANTEGTYRNLVMHVFFQAVAVRNEYAINYLLKCFDLVRKHKDIYRHEVKKYLKQTEREKSNYCSMTSRFAYNDELVDFLDETSAKFMDHISNASKTFYQTIRKEMTDKGVINADFFAHIEMCSVILDSVTMIFEKEANSEFEMRDSFQQLDYMKIDRMKESWKKVCGHIYSKNFPWEVNLNTKKCKVAYKGMLKAMRDYEFILSLITKKDDKE